MSVNSPIYLDMTVAADSAALSMKVAADSAALSMKVAAAISYETGAEFEGPYEYVPTEAAQTIPIDGKTATQDIVVDPIPPEYLIPAGTKEITANGPDIDVAAFAKVDVAVPVPDPDLQIKSASFTPSESPQALAVRADAGHDGLDEVDVIVDAVPSDYVGSAIDRRDSTNLSASGAAVTAPAGYYAAAASKAVASGTEGTPSASKGAVSNHALDVTPAVTNAAGYIAGGTKTGTPVTVTAAELESGTKEISANGTGIDVTGYAAVDVAVPAPAPSLQTKSVSFTPSESAQSQAVTADTGYDGLDEVDVSVAAVPSNYVGSAVDRRDSTDLTASGATVTAPAGYYAAAASKSVASGTEGTPSASKGAVSNHSVDVTPSVTNAAGYINGGTKTGTPVTVTAAELASGTKEITANGTGIDVTGYAAVDVAVPGSSVDVEALSVTQNGTYTAPAGKAYSPVTVSVSGGASNIVQGTFTGSTAGTVLTVSVPYTGSGYPLVIAIYPSEGSYNSSGTFYKKKQRYATCCYFASKCYPDRTPSYPASGGSYGDTMTVVNVYKSSSTTSYSLTRGGESNRAVFVTMNPSEMVGGIVTMGSNKSMKVYIANTSYGFASGIEYVYNIIYSS